MCAEKMGSRDCSYCLCQNLQPLILLLTNQIKANKQKTENKTNNKISLRCEGPLLAIS